ncbi:MAG TPA: protease modulator HflK [Candidatus Paceibacterota bacterium]|nr:protease modulator HflK [Verrucomicrobiota bacterium]HSA10734.1 protease modulator HflK [Candidatus Paceibacterota bacterium]
MNDHPHTHDQPPAPELPPETPVDAGSQALAEALRSSFAIVKVLMVLLALLFLASGMFTVGPQERAILLRFGKPVGQGEAALLLPGLHWSLPYPIDEVIKVSISGVQQVSSTVGWYAVTPEQMLAGVEPQAGATLNPVEDGYALTADANIIHTRATLTYRIKDPIQYVFSFVNASNAVQNALDNSLLFATARFKVDDILTRDIAGFQEAVRRRATQLADLQNLGIVIEQCAVQSVPPRQLKDAFASVLKAEVMRSKVLNEARSAENQLTNKASADAESLVNLAQSYRTNLVSSIAAQAEVFQKLLPEYQRYPGLFVEQRLTETMGRVLTNAQDKIFLADSPRGKSRELRLLLNREVQRPIVEEPKP